jgi:hypothetical protein
MIDYDDLNKRLTVAITRQKQVARWWFVILFMVMTGMCSAMAFAMLAGHPATQAALNTEGAPLRLVWFLLSGGLGLLGTLTLIINALMDSKVAEEHMRQDLATKEVAAQLLERGMNDSTEKAKRLGVPDDQAVTISDDGEIVPLEEYEQQQSKRAHLR